MPACRLIGIRNWNPNGRIPEASRLPKGRGESKGCVDRRDEEKSTVKASGLNRRLAVSIPWCPPWRAGRA